MRTLYNTEYHRNRLNALSHGETTPAEDIFCQMFNPSMVNELRSRIRFRAGREPGWSSMLSALNGIATERS